MQISNVQVAYHRNGVAGIGFHVVLFTWKDTDAQPTKNRQMIASVFHEAGAVVVLDVQETAEGNITFANGNSWRGDHFEAALRQAIAEHEEAENAYYRALPFHTPPAKD